MVAVEVVAYALPLHEVEAGCLALRENARIHSRKMKKTEKLNECTCSTK